MSSHFALRLVAWTAAALVAVLGPAGVAAAGDMSDMRLLKTYEPVLVFHPNEQLRPTIPGGTYLDPEAARTAAAAVAAQGR